jgi:hypothetical protein
MSTSTACHPQTDSSVEHYQCCCSKLQQMAKHLFPKTCLVLQPLKNSLVYDTSVYYQANMFDNVFYLLVPSTVFTALHMCGFTSVSSIMSFQHIGSGDDAGNSLSTNEK